MEYRAETFERAFVLARSGTCRNSAEIKKRLIADDFPNVMAHITGSLANQLAAICRETYSSS